MKRTSKKKYNIIKPKILIKKNFKKIKRNFRNNSLKLVNTKNFEFLKFQNNHFEILLDQSFKVSFSFNFYEKLYNIDPKTNGFKMRQICNFFLSIYFLRKYSVRILFRNTLRSSFFTEFCKYFKIKLSRPLRIRTLPELFSFMFKSVSYLKKFSLDLKFIFRNSKDISVKTTYLESLKVLFFSFLNFHYLKEYYFNYIKVKNLGLPNPEMKKIIISRKYVPSWNQVRVEIHRILRENIFRSRNLTCLKKKFKFLSSSNA